MSRRNCGGGIGEMFSRMLKSTAEWNRGIIRWYPLGYRFSAEGWTNRGGVHFDPSKDQDGKDVSLYEKRSTQTCPRPDFQGVYPRLECGYDVPASACRQCPHHEARRRGKNFPSCKMLYEARKGEPSPGTVVAGLYSKALEQVSDLLAGKT